MNDTHDNPATGEWTHEKLQGLLQISNEDRYVADYSFENTLDEINAALAADREKVKKSQTEVNQLNNLLHEVGWGQGEIDSAATVAEENQQLREALKHETELARVSEVNNEVLHHAAKTIQQLCEQLATVKGTLEESKRRLERLGQQQGDPSEDFDVETPHTETPNMTTRQAKLLKAAKAVLNSNSASADLGSGEGQDLKDSWHISTDALRQLKKAVES